MFAVDVHYTDGYRERVSTRIFDKLSEARNHAYTRIAGEYYVITGYDVLQRGYIVLPAFAFQEWSPHS